MKATWMAALALLGFALPLVATPDQDAYTDLVKSPNFKDISETVRPRFWTLSGLSAVALKDRLNEVEQVAHDAGMSRSTTDLLRLQTELADQARAAKKAYEASLSGTGDIDTLVDDVVVTDKGANETAYLKAISEASQDLYLTMGKLIDARFLAAAPSGIPRTGTPVSPTQARAIAQTVQRDHVEAYEKTMLEVSSQLRTLLDLGPQK